jgi:CubicO group peptidase (beta-lactamase class C family)
MRQRLDEHAAEVLGSGMATAAAVAVTDPDRTLIAHYSNVGYRAVGVALEAVTGESYGDLVQRRVLDQLDLTVLEDSCLSRDRRDTVRA